MSYYVLKNKGQVVDVVADDSKTTPDVNKLLADGKIDSIEKVANFDALKGIIFPDGVITRDESQFDRLVRQLTSNAEGFLNDLSKKLEVVTSEAKNKGIGEVAKRAKSAGEALLKDVREIHKKALEKTKKNK
jgi:hypothetical protein